MKTFVAGLLCLLLPLAPAWAEAPMQVYTRATQLLDGEWKVIVDPYENGYYNYRYQPFDQQADPPKGAYFRDAKPGSPTDLVEYDFDTAMSLQVPGDWNTQDRGCTTTKAASGTGRSSMRRRAGRPTACSSSSAR